MACVCVCVSIPPPLAVRACAAVFASAPLGAGQGGDIPCEPERETKSQPKESNRAKPPPRTARPARDTAHTAAHTARHRVPQAPRVRDTPAHRGSPRLTATRRQATHRDSRQTATHRDRPRQTATHRDTPRQATHRHTPASPTSALLETATKTFDRRNYFLLTAPFTTPRASLPRPRRARRVLARTSRDLGGAVRPARLSRRAFLV